ncbi:MAG: hypothetical protein AAB495_01710 [Patescibacteria group bacterium]
MQKIFVGKSEIIAEVIERILETSDPDVTLVIPKESTLHESASNFSLLSREAKALKKRIIIESVDEKILSFAKTHKLEAIHPLFGEGGERSFSDIMPLSHRTEKKKGGGVKIGVKNTVTARREEIEDDIYEEEVQNGARKLVVESEEEYESPQSEERRRFPWKLVGIFLAVCVLVLGTAWVVDAKFKKAEITIRFKQAPWEYQNTFLAGVATAKVNAEKNLLPAQLFEDQESDVRSFPATGRSSVSEKARGVITIHNAYSSAPQQLVKTTRFETPDGKIFRLESQVIVPGAKIVDGKIEPASIKADVVADKPGPEQNLGPTPRLIIPGFKGSPKYDGFYGALEDGTSGGMFGDRAVPTEEDISKARDRIQEIFTSTFRSTFLGSIPKDLKLLDGATSFEIAKFTVNRTTDDQGNFTVTAKGSFKAIVFREQDIISILEAGARKSYPDLSIKDSSLVYTAVNPDFSKKELSFSLSAQTSLVPTFDKDLFTKSIVGKDADEAKGIVQKLPELGDAKLSIWPSWAGRLPDTVERVEIIVQ